MDRFMRRRNAPSLEPHNCTLGVEPLEDRCPLSGVQLPASPPTESGLPLAEVASIPRSTFAAAIADSTAVTGVAVEVVKFGVAAPDGESNIDLSQLPKEVVAALDSRFPGSE